MASKSNNFFKTIIPFMDFDNRKRFDFESYLYRYGIIKDLGEVRRLLGKGGKVLDLGCGKGHLTAYLNTLGLDAHGIDLKNLEGDQQQVKDSKWRKNYWETFANKYGCRYKTYNGAEIPYRNGFFDAVVAYAVVEHVDELQLEKLLQDARRVLKSGGYFFVYRCPNKYSYSEKLAKLMRLPAHDTLYTPQSLKKLVTTAGFDVIETGRSDMFIEFPPRKFNSIYNAVSPLLAILEAILIKTPLKLFSHHLYLVAKKP
jgi:SAM-dependent methyltransferase